MQINSRRFRTGKDLRDNRGQPSQLWDEKTKAQSGNVCLQIHHWLSREMKSESRLHYPPSNALSCKPEQGSQPLKASFQCHSTQLVTTNQASSVHTLSFSMAVWTGSHFSVCEFRQGFCLLILASNFHSRIWDGPKNEIIILYEIWLT